MKTEDLIKAVVADNTSVKPPISRTLALSLVAGVLAAAGIFAATIGVRSDFWWSISNAPRFVFKFIFTLAIAIPAFLLVRRLARPDPPAGAITWLLLLPALLLSGAVLLEMSEVPREHWSIYAMGTNSIACMTLIPLLSLAPLAAVLYALRQGAPANPALAGAIGGLLSAGIGATLYASHCADDSPLFVSIWYPIGIALVVGAGAVVGSRLLKW